ncbi:MAG TPA: helicase associated domain-containing protein [Chthoniobacteraceae bacterium]|jgi:hypothetical protein|nr:helicase associated domain-containing protein [Chthoniobacteraceae bacterium]
MSPRTKKRSASSAPSNPPASDGPLPPAGDAWQRAYYQLVLYHRQHGHCDVQGPGPALRKLAAWVAEQRELQLRGQLRPDRQAALDELQFTWDTAEPGGKSLRAVQDDGRWQLRYQELVSFQKTHGHTRVPKLAPGNLVLWKWRHVQREWRRKGILKPERIARLEAIGFEWDDPGRVGRSREERWENQWEQFFQQLVLFRERFGHCRVGGGWLENPALALWVRHQRVIEKRGQLPPDRQARLDALHFEWALKPHGNLVALWERRFGEFLAFQQATGHTRVPKGPPGKRVLWKWRHVQREFRRKGTLKPERIARLDAIGFEWEEPDRFGTSQLERWDNQWERQFQKLVEFKARHGHCRVSSGRNGDFMLAHWVTNQRSFHRHGDLRPDRAARLTALGFEWQRGLNGTLADLWEKRFAELQAFVQEHGHTRVPKRPPGNKVLWHWRMVQREFRRKGTLKPERIARLDALGFEWEDRRGLALSHIEHHQQRWAAKLEQLRQFQERFGHTRVPKSWRENRSLGAWAQIQRRAIREEKISEGRLARLTALGFA